MGFEHTQSAVALIGLEGFRLLGALEVDAELHQLVEHRGGRGTSGLRDRGAVRTPTATWRRGRSKPRPSRRGRR
jgi:hypothetical protein